MKNFYLFLIFLILPLFLSSQDANIDSTSFNGVSLNGEFGSISFGGQSYTRIRLLPEFMIWKFGVGLDIDLLLDSDGNIVEEDWDEFEDYLNKIYYVRFGKRGDIFYTKIGGFTNYTLGKGLIMNGYTNMINFPELRQIGVQVGGKLPFAGINMEFFSSNYTKNEILAGRLSAIPLESSGMPFFNKLNLGFSFATDRNQFGNISDKDGDKYPDVFDDFPDNKNYHLDSDSDGYADEIDSDLDGDNLLDYEYVKNNWTDMDSLLIEEMLNAGYLDDDIYRKIMHQYSEKDAISIIGFDYELPLIQTDLLYLSNYAEFAKIIDHSYGVILPGFYSKFLIFDMRLEFRHYSDDFEPNFFNQLYDVERSIVFGDTILTKEQTIKNINSSSGWYGSVTTQIFNLMFFNISYEDMYGKDIQNGKSIWSSIYLKPNLIPKISTAKISYTQTRVDNIFSDYRTPTSMIDGKIGFNITPNSQLVGLYQERYIDMNGDNKIEGKEEVLKTMNFGIEISF